MVRSLDLAYARTAQLLNSCFNNISIALRCGHGLAISVPTSPTAIFLACIARRVIHRRVLGVARIAIGQFVLSLI